MNRLRRKYTNKIQNCPAPQLKLTGEESIDWWSKGIEYHQQGNLVQAEACYRKITPFMPEYLFTRNNLGLLCNTLGRFDEAETYCKQALALQPDYLAAHINLSNTLLSLNRYEEAEKICRHALVLSPKCIEALGTLGNILTTQGEMHAAETMYRQALAIQPDAIEILNSLGNILSQTSREGEAELIYRTAITLKPDYVDALNNLGNVLISLNKLDEAKEVLHTALSFQPDAVHALLNLGLVLSSLGDLDAAANSYRQALKYQPNYINALSNLLFMHNYRNENLAEAFADAKRYGKLVKASAKPFNHTAPPFNPRQRLRIGLLSGDLLNHPVGYFLDGVIQSLSTQQVEMFVYSTFFKEDELTQRLKAAIPNWRMVVGLSDEKLAKLIQADGIQILMDLSGHTARNRLSVFAWKPAPIQITWLGYFATTGVEAMDYILGDPFNLPANEADHFVETPWQLPDCYLSFTPPNLPFEVTPLPALTNGFITFGCCNSIKKMTDTVIACWARVLNANPESRLFLKCSSLADPVMQQNVLARFAQCAIPTHRLILEGPSSRKTYFAAYNKFDIALDPFPYPGVTTTAEGLWMGIPVITLRGNTFLSHQGESILSNAGLPDWVANDIDDYVAKTVHFASDLPKLAELRAQLRQQVLQSTLYDTQKFADNLIIAWQEMWRTWCAKEHPTTT